jgi:putative FmdB family regulatory protein
MPLIEYRCSQCARVFERLVLHAEGAGRAECPDCGERTGNRLVSLFAPVRGEARDSMATAGGACCGGAGGCACGR